MTDRRSFLKATATAALATAGAGAAGCRAQPPSGDLRFALIGAGGQGSHIAEQLLKVEGTKLAAICEIFPANRAKWTQKVPGLAVYDDWDELLSKESDLQAVLVALPEHVHSVAAIAALKAGKHVFCEKPMAYSLEQGRAMIAAQEESGKVLQIGQQRRSNPLYYLARQLVQKKGFLGEVCRVDTFWDRNADWKRPNPRAVEEDFGRWGYPTPNHLVNWRLFRRYGHGLMTENGTHQLDAAGWLLGDRKPLGVCGVGAVRFKDGRETFDVASADYRYEGDTIVRFTQDFHQGFNYAWEYGELFLGSEGALRITDEKHLVHYGKNSRAGVELKASDLGSIEFPGLHYTAEDLAKIEDFRTFSYENEMRIFANCVRDGLTPTCTARIGFESIVPTILGSVAQVERKYVEIGPETWA